MDLNIETCCIYDDENIPELSGFPDNLYSEPSNKTTTNRNKTMMKGSYNFVLMLYI